LLELHLDDAADVWFIVGHEDVKQLVVAGHESDECGDVLAMPAQFEQQLGDVRAVSHENQQNRVRGQHGNNCGARSELENGGQQISAICCGPEFVRRGNNGGNARRDVLGVEPRRELAIDEESVASQNDRGVDAFALPDDGDQISDARWGHSGASARVESRGEARVHNYGSQATPIA